MIDVSACVLDLGLVTQSPAMTVRHIQGFIQALIRSKGLSKFGLAHAPPVSWTSTCRPDGLGRTPMRAVGGLIAAHIGRGAKAIIVIELEAKR